MFASGGAANERACAKTSLLYAHYADSGETQAFVDLFTEDAVWETTTGRYVGRDAIETQVQGMGQARPRMRHVVTNQLIFVESPSRATGSAYFTLYVAAPDADSLDGQPAMVGTYDDEYAIEGDTCRFERRTSRATFRRTPAG